MAGKVKVTEDELAEIKYAARNNGRNFVSLAAGADEPHNATIENLMARGFFVDGGPSTFGRWRNLTPAGRALSTTGELKS